MFLLFQIMQVYVQREETQFFRNLNSWLYYMVFFFWAAETHIYSDNLNVELVKQSINYVLIYLTNTY